MITSAQIAQQHNAFNMGLGANPAAYQNVMFGGMTPYGQGFGNTMALGGISGAKSVVDAGLMAGMIGSGINSLSGWAGLGQSKALGSVAGALGGNLSLGMHFGPIMAAQAAMGRIVEGVKQGQATQNEMNRWAGNRANMGGAMGFGVSRRAAKDLTESMRSLADMPEMFTSLGELNKIMSKINDMNLLQGARNAGDFKRKFKGVVSALRSMSRDLGSTMEEALPFLQSSVNQGFLNASEQVRNVRMLQASSAIGIGVGRGTLNQMQEAGAAAIRNMGGDSRFGATGMRQISNELSIAQQSGLMSQEDITRITGKVGEEGNRAASQMLFGAQTRFMQSSGVGRMLTAGLAERDEDGNFTGRLDQDRLRKFRTGQLSNADITRVGREAMTGDNAISFENAMARGLGAEAGSQMGTTGLASAINQILADSNITSIQAQRRMVAQLTGLRQDMADKLLDLAKGSSLMMANESRQITQAVARQLRIAHYKENQTISGMMTQFGTYLRANIMSPLDRIGTSLGTDIGEAGDELALEVSKRSGVGKVIAAIAGVPRMALRSGQKMLGLESGITANQAQFFEQTSQDFALDLATDKNMTGDTEDFTRGSRDSLGRFMGDFRGEDEYGGSLAGLGASSGLMFAGRSGALGARLATVGGALSLGQLATTGGAISGLGTALSGQGALRSVSSSLMKSGGTGLKKAGRRWGKKWAKKQFMKKVVLKGAASAAKFAGGLALRVLGGPIGLLWTAAEVGMLGMDYLESREEQNKVKAWAMAAGVNEDEALDMFENSEDPGNAERIREANSNIAKNLREGKFVPGLDSNNPDLDEDFKKAYGSLVESGKLASIIEKGGSRFDMLANIKETMEDAGVDVSQSGRVTKLLSAISRGYDTTGKTSTIRKGLGGRMTDALAGAQEFTEASKLKLAKLQVKTSEFFTDDFKSETAKDIMVSGSALSRQALTELLGSKEMQASLMNATPEEFRAQYPDFSALTNEQILALKNDLQADLGEHTGEDRVERQDEIAGIVDTAEKVANLARDQEIQAKMANVRTVGSELMRVQGGKKLGALLMSGRRSQLRGVGKAALDMINQEGFDISKVKGRPASLLKGAQAIQGMMKGLEGAKTEEEVKEALKSRFAALKEDPTLLDEVFRDSGDTVEDSELKDLTERLVTMDSMSKLLHGDTMSEEALRQSGGKTGITAKYLKAAEDAAKAHTVFVRAVYASKTHEGIQEEVKEKQ